MPVYLSNAYRLSPAGKAESWKPRICFHNLVTFSNVTADQENADYPATNLSNPSTNLLWKSGSTAAQNLTVLFSHNDDVDNISIARHNFGSGLIPVTVEGLTPGGDPDDDGDWFVLVAEQLLADDATAVFIFEPTTVAGLRLVLVPDAVEPQCAVLNCGTSITLPYGLPLGHRPIHLARSAESLTPMSQGGDYLGSVELTAKLSSSIDLKHLDKDWYDANLRELALLGKQATFFFAWNPQDYPSEAAFCWTTNDPQPIYATAPGLVDITFEIGGVAA